MGTPGSVRCEKCGYSLEGLLERPGAVCPECAKPVLETLDEIPRGTPAQRTTSLGAYFATVWALLVRPKETWGLLRQDGSGSFHVMAVTVVVAPLSNAFVWLVIAMMALTFGAGDGRDAVSASLSLGSLLGGVFVAAAAFVGLWVLAMVVARFRRVTLSMVGGLSVAAHAGSLMILGPAAALLMLVPLTAWGGRSGVTKTVDPFFADLDVFTQIALIVHVLVPAVAVIAWTLRGVASLRSRNASLAMSPEVLEDLIRAQRGEPPVVRTSTLQCASAARGALSCGACGYSLEGLLGRPGAVCPECGRPVLDTLNDFPMGTSFQRRPSPGAYIATVWGLVVRPRETWRQVRITEPSRGRTLCASSALLVPVLCPLVALPVDSLGELLGGHKTGTLGLVGVGAAILGPFVAVAVQFGLWLAMIAVLRIRGLGKCDEAGAVIVAHATTLAILGPLLAVLHIIPNAMGVSPITHGYPGTPTAGDEIARVVYLGMFTTPVLAIMLSIVQGLRYLQWPNLLHDMTPERLEELRKIQRDGEGRREAAAPVSHL